MADYTDLAQINVLYQQSQQIAQAITYLDAGSGPAMVTIGPPPDDMEGGSAVMIPTHGPFTQEFLDELRQILVARETDLAQQLVDLGVSATPTREVPKTEAKSGA